MRVDLVGGTPKFTRSNRLGTRYADVQSALRQRCTPMGKLRILIADDHEAVREGLKAILNRHPDLSVVGEAVDGTSAVAQTKQLLPDLVIMDVSMPDLNGLAATQAIKASCPKVHVI